jgi:hypothetical protein
MKGPGVVVYACYLSYGRQRLGGWWFKVSPGKKLARPYLNKLGTVAYACNPSNTGGTGRRIMVQGQPLYTQKSKILSEKVIKVKHKWGSMGQVLESLPSEREALNSNSGT